MKQVLQESVQGKLIKGQLQLKSLGYTSGGYTSETYDYTYGPEIANNNPPVSAVDCKICTEK